MKELRSNTSTIFNDCIKSCLELARSFYDCLSVVHLEIYSPILCAASFAICSMSRTRYFGMEMLRKYENFET